jgi:Zn ribbon nucleic-acid-binding protein
MSFVYYYKCKSCEDVVELEWQEKAIAPTKCVVCGHEEEFQWLGGKAPATMVTAYRDGVKRPGFAEAKEAAKLTAQASNTAANSETRKEIKKEILKMGVKPGKGL